MNQPFRVFAPGRIVLSGEHQDYIGLPVLSQAIPYYQIFEVYPTNSHKIVFTSEATNEKITFSTDDILLDYNSSRDYVRSAWNVVSQYSLSRAKGAFIRSLTEFTVAAGLASSSAFVTGLIEVFLQLKGIKKIDPLLRAKLAFNAEVTEFNEPGGMQDHLASSFGGTNFLTFSPNVTVTPLKFKLKGHLFIVNSGSQKKDTVGDLAILKEQLLIAINNAKETDPTFDLQIFPTKLVSKLGLNNKEETLLEGILEMRNITLTLKRELRVNEGIISHKLLGEFLNKQQIIIESNLEIKNKLIQKTIHDVLNLGAEGAKVNGSGKGGAIIAVFPPETDEKQIEEQIKNAGYSVFPVKSAGKGCLTTTNF